MTIFTKFFKKHLTIPQATNLFEEVKSQTHPDTNDLKRLVNFHKAPVGTKEEMQALDLKYRAMTHVPATIEKTMTPSQLFVVDSPLWALNFAGEDIDKLLKRLKDEPRTEETFNIALRSIQNPMLILDEFGNLRLNKLHPRNKATLVKQEHLT